MKKSLLLIALTIAVFLCQPSFAQNFEQQALDKKLHQSILWQRLSHYQVGGESYIDDPKFFLAENGKHSAKDELQASLKRLQQEPELQCRYPARVAWLSQQLPGFKKALPEASCPKYQLWRSKVGDYGVTLVLASSFLNSPSSMYGHTFLRFDDSAEGIGESLGAYAVNFGAEVGQDSEGLMYAIKGLFGGYNGFFSDGPYYEKVKEYSRFDNRDVWEYRLNLRGEEMNRLLMHLWELQNINFDYFFFDENCSYRLLELLEVARPSVRLSEGYGLYTIPVDTIWSVEDAGLVENVVYRPSNQTNLQFNIDKLSPAEQAMAKRLSEDMGYWQSDNIKALSDERRYQVALVAYQTLRFNHNKTRREQSIANHSLNLLLKIKKYSAYGENDTPEKPTEPTQGHRTTAFTFVGGSEGGEGFADLGFRLSYHDLLDNVPAYAKGMSLNMGSLVLRAKDSHLQLQQLDIVEINSVNPRSRFFKPLSWQVRTGLERQWTFGDDELVGHFTGGGGLTYKLWGDLNAYGMGLAKLEYNPGFERNLDVAVGAEFGLLYQKSFGAFHAKVESFYFAKDYLRRQLSVGYQQRLATNHGLRLQFKRVLNEKDAVNEASLAYRFYY